MGLDFQKESIDPKGLSGLSEFDANRPMLLAFIAFDV